MSQDSASGTTPGFVDHRRLGLMVLLGDRVAHSLSPVIQNALARRYDVDWRYAALPVGPSDLEGTMVALRVGTYLGANVTSPYKERAAALVDELVGEAARLGAINTIRRRDGLLEGHNTDVVGLQRALEGNVDFANPFDAAILGVGGAARAAVLALASLPALRSIRLYARTPERGRRLMDDLAIDRIAMDVASFDDWRAADLVINATPVGTSTTDAPLLAAAALGRTRVLFDMTYTQAETPLMREARSAGATTLNGLPMLVHQALAAFEIWTGITPEVAHLPPTILEMLEP